MRAVQLEKRVLGPDFCVTVSRYPHTKSHFRSRQCKPWANCLVAVFESRTNGASLRYSPRTNGAISAATDDPRACWTLSRASQSPILVPFESRTCSDAGKVLNVARSRLGQCAFFISAYSVSGATGLQYLLTRFEESGSGQARFDAGCTRSIRQARPSRMSKLPRC